MFNTIVVQPLLNILFIIYAAIPGQELGVAIVVLTLLIRFALFPLAKKQINSQKAISELQPEVNRLKEKYKNDPQKLQAATLELYKEKEINPFGSCLPLILQLPFLFGLFYVFIKFKDPSFLQLNDNGVLSQIYPWVKDLSFVKNIINSQSLIDADLFGLDLAHPSLILAIVAGALQFVQSKMLTPKKKKDEKANMAAQMSYIFPLMTIFVASRLPAALALYWGVTTIFAIVQQYLVIHRDIEKLEEGNEKKRSRKSKKNR